MPLWMCSQHCLLIACLFVRSLCIQDPGVYYCQNKAAVTHPGQVQLPFHMSELCCCLPGPAPETLTCGPRASATFPLSSLYRGPVSILERTTNTVTVGEMSYKSQTRGDNLGRSSRAVMSRVFGFSPYAVRERCLCWAEGGSCQVSGEGTQEC